jgi:serine/threonine-protein kinase
VAYQELLPLLPGMSLALPPGGTAADLVLQRTLQDSLGPDALTRVESAFAAAEALISPDVMPLLEHVAQPGQVTACYPWRDGVPLAGALARAREAGVMPTPQVSGRIMSEALGALAALHAHKTADAAKPLTHGAFRADSLWLGFDGRLQLCDAGFSMACSLLEQPLWALRAPRADVSQAGVLMYVVLTGAMPQGMAAEGGHDPRKANPTVPEQLAHLVMSATDPNPDNRPADANELKEQWDAAVGLLGGMALHTQVSRWLCTIFPSNHPLVEALRRALQPLGAGGGLPLNQGPLLSNARLAPIKDKEPLRTVSSPRIPAVDAPVPQVSAPHPVVLDANQPVPTVSTPRAISLGDLTAVPAPPVSTPRGVPLLDLATTAPQVSQSRLAPLSAPSPIPEVSSPQLPPVVAAPAPAQPSAPLDDAAMEAAFLAEAAPAPSPPLDLPAVTDPVSAAPPTPAPAVRPVAPDEVTSPILSVSSPVMAPVVVAPVVVAPPPPVEPQPTPAQRAVTPASTPAAPAPRSATGNPRKSSRSTTTRRRAVAPVEPELEFASDDLVLDAPPPARRGPPPAAIAVVGMLLGGVAVAAFIRFNQPPPPVAAVSDPLEAVEQPPAQPAPPPVAPPAAEKPRPAPTPAPAPARPAKKASGSAQRSAPAVDDGDAATLTLTVTPWAHVWVDGRKVGRTPLKPLKLAPGKHVIRMENPDLRATKTEKVDLQPGMYGELTVTFSGG